MHEDFELVAELGAGPLALDRGQRAQTARVLIESSTLPMADVAFAAGFSSIRTFNDTVREVFSLSPSELRARVKRHPQAVSSGTLILRLPFRAPLAPSNLFGHLAATAVPGVEEWRDGAYRRTLRLRNGWGIVSLRPMPDHIACQLTLTDLRDLPVAISRSRWLLDLDADPVAVDELLARDSVLAPLIAESPGRRVPRTVDGNELAVRIVLGQQVSTAAARTHASRLVLAHGERIDDPVGGLTHLFPEPDALADIDPETLAMPRTRRVTLTTLAATLARGDIDLSAGADSITAREALAKLPGLGPWSIESIAMRALGDPDAFLATDLGIRLAAKTLGLPEAAGALGRRSMAWSPWRAYAVQYLWATGQHPINRLPD
ncbi:AlkA N-terminal domain-containing protein [Humibacter soli]